MSVLDKQNDQIVVYNRIFTYTFYGQCLLSVSALKKKKNILNDLIYPRISPPFPNIKIHFHFILNNFSIFRNLVIFIIELNFFY